MPSVRVDEKFICDVCKQEYNQMKDAAECENSHDIIYIPMIRADLSKLLAFLNTGNAGYLSDSLISTLKKYDRLRGD